VVVPLHEGMPIRKRLFEFSLTPTAAEREPDVDHQEVGERLPFLVLLRPVIEDAASDSHEAAALVLGMDDRAHLSELLSALLFGHRLHLYLRAYFRRPWRSLAHVSKEAMLVLATAAARTRVVASDLHWI